MQPNDINCRIKDIACWIKGEMTEIFTIGHSNHDMLHFLGILRRHRIEMLVDVRSEPYSRYAPQFNKEGTPAVRGNRRDAVPAIPAPRSAESRRT